MTREEAIKHLENLLGFVFDPAWKKACQMATEALRQQTPQKVCYKLGNYDCPVCNKPAMTVSARRKKYCDFCGQAIDWSEHDD